MKSSGFLASSQWARVSPLLILFVLSAITAQGQTYVFGRADFPADEGPISIAKGDFNGGRHYRPSHCGRSPKWGFCSVGKT
jgi:hypothetical protein